MVIILNLLTLAALIIVCWDKGIIYVLLIISIRTIVSFWVILYLIVSNIIRRSNHVDDLHSNVLKVLFIYNIHMTLSKRLIRVVEISQPNYTN